MRLFLSTLSFISLPLHFAFAGAWTVETGKWENYHDITYYSTDFYYDAQGNRQDQDRYSKAEIGHRSEYGLREGLTFGTSHSLAAVKGTQTTQFANGGQFSSTQWNVGLVDPKFYLRKRVWQNEQSVASGQATLKLPSFFNDDTIPRSGSDEFSYELRLLGGHNYKWLNRSHFANAELAYELRPQNSADLIHFDITTGLKYDKNWMFLPQIFSTWSMSGNSNFTQTSDDAYDLIKGQLSAIYRISPTLAVQAGGFHHLYARNSGGGSGATLSLWLK